jgi:hypothetical protein
MPKSIKAPSRVKAPSRTRVETPSSLQAAMTAATPGGRTGTWYSFWNSISVAFQSEIFTRPERKKTLKVAARQITAITS